MMRRRIPGEVIAPSDVVLIGERAFGVSDTCLIGMPVLRGELNAVYTSEPRTTLHEPFPAKPERPTCANCEAPSTHVWDVDYEPKRYLCQPCFQEWEHNEERNERALHAD